MLQAAIDTGGTFTDVVSFEKGDLTLKKVPSTPSDPTSAVLHALSFIGKQPDTLVHGSTIATNAFLERRGARLILLTTAGFEDLVEIGRQNRPALYRLSWGEQQPLVETEHRLSVKERIASDGAIIQPLSQQEMDRIEQEVEAANPEAIAIAFLHAYRNPLHEKMLLGRFTSWPIPVSASHQLLPEFREYERAIVTALNAYVAPIASRYMSSLNEAVTASRLWIMQSNGGAITAQEACQEPIRTLLSGPAGGVVAAMTIAHRAGFDRIISFDMGGTSTDVSLVDGDISITREGQIGGLPLRLPMIDIHTVGAGGGSIATLDEGGVLIVGPSSAGAEPGPVCYGQGGHEVTVTDANLYAGRLHPDFFLGGERSLDTSAAARAIQALAKRAGLRPDALASGILSIANTRMEQALRAISLDRGYDCRDFTLVCYGGASAMHACSLARSLGIRRVLIPQHPGCLSAVGMLLADAKRDHSLSVLKRSDEVPFEKLEEQAASLMTRGGEELQAYGFSPEQIVFFSFLELRYAGQGYELRVPLQKDYPQLFHDTHAQRYGYARPQYPIEVVNLLVEAVGRSEKPPFERPSSPRGPTQPKSRGRLEILFSAGREPVPFFERHRLEPGDTIQGPALITEYSSTTLIDRGFTGQIDPMGNLLLGKQRSMEEKRSLSSAEGLRVDRN